jgi:hypothetical protein
MDELGTVLPNDQAFFMFNFLLLFKSISVTFISHVHLISCHCFSFFHLTIFPEETAIAIWMTGWLT